MKNKKDEIAEFYKQILSDAKLKEKLEEKAKTIVNEEDLRKLIREEIMPLMKKFKVNFSEEELLEYEEKSLKELSAEDLEGVSGGMSVKSALITGGVLSMALFGGGVLANQNVTSAQVNPPVAQSTSTSATHVGTQKKSYAPFRKYFNSAKNQAMNILGFLGQNRTADEILNFLRGLDAKTLQMLDADANHLIPQIKELEGWGLYLYGAHSADFSVPSNDLQIIRNLPQHISTVENERNQASVNTAAEEEQDDEDLLLVFDSEINNEDDTLDDTPQEEVNSLHDNLKSALKIASLLVAGSTGYSPGGVSSVYSALKSVAPKITPQINSISEKLSPVVNSVKAKIASIRSNTATNEEASIADSEDAHSTTSNEASSILAQSNPVIDSAINNESEVVTSEAEGEINAAHDEVSASEVKDEIGSKEEIAQTEEASVTSETEEKEAHEEEAEAHTVVAQAEESAEASEVKDEVENKEEVDSSKEASVTSETEEKSDDIKDDTAETKEEDNDQTEDKESSEAVEAQTQSEESKNGEQRRATFAEDFVKSPQIYAKKYAKIAPKSAMKKKLSEIKNKLQQGQMIQQLEQKNK